MEVVLGKKRIGASEICPETSLLNLLLPCHIPGSSAWLTLRVVQEGPIQPDTEHLGKGKREKGQIR